MLLAPPVRFVLLASVLAFVAGCGGATIGLVDPPGDDGGTPPGTPKPNEVPAYHRPTAPSCPAHGGSGVACTTDAQCQMLQPGQDGQSFCFDGTCGPDECLSDGDCPGGQVCSCAGSTFGYAHQSPGNVCVPANCRTDADCGAGGYCSPSVTFDCGPFYGVQGYDCHRPGDACTNDSDCGGDGGLGQPYCAYDGQTGRWACGDSFCAG